MACLIGEVFVEYRVHHFLMHKFVSSILVFIFSIAPVGGATAVDSNNLTMIASSPSIPGEKLVYEGKFSKIIRGITIGEMTFEYLDGSNGTNQISMEAKSKGTLLRLFRFSFTQRYQSDFTPELKVTRTTKFDQQKERVRESEAIFDHEIGKVTYTERNPKAPLNAPRVIATDFNGEVYDLLTGIYVLRTLPLKVGATFEFSVSDSGLVYRVPVKVTKREIQNTAIGKVMCFRLEPEVFGEDRFIEQKGQMVIWITDDERRVPVRSLIKAEIGQVDIRLKSFTPGGQVTSLQTAK